MTTPGSVPRASSRTRPAGYAPRGTSLGFVGLVALAAGVPFTALECAAPYTTGGFDRWLNSVPYVVGLALLPMVVLIAGLRSHRFWTVCLFYYLGQLLLIAYALTVLFALAALAGLFPLRDPDIKVMNVVGLVILVCLAPFAWFLRRALRLRYWQPSSTPDQWEAGDEGPPSWSPFQRRPKS